MTSSTIRPFSTDSWSDWMQSRSSLLWLDKTEIPPHCFVTGSFMLGKIWSKLVRINKVLTRISSAQRMDKQSVGPWQLTELLTCCVKQISDAGNNRKPWWCVSCRVSSMPVNHSSYLCTLRACKRRHLKELYRYVCTVSYISISLCFIYSIYSGFELNTHCLGFKANKLSLLAKC